MDNEDDSMMGQGGDRGGGPNNTQVTIPKDVSSLGLVSAGAGNEKKHGRMSMKLLMYNVELEYS